MTPSQSQVELQPNRSFMIASLLAMIAIAVLGWMQLAR